MSEAGLVLDEVVVAPWGATLLASTSLIVPAGSTLAVVGDAGTGKSTVLAALAGRMRPLSGEVRLDGRPVTRCPVGFAEQQHDLPDGLTAAEHLAVPLLARRRRATTWDDVEALLASLGLPEAARHNLLEELSGGQQQRVAVARALVGEPPLICLDDPTSELDAASARLVWDAVRRAADRGAVVVVATTNEQDAERLDASIRLI